MARGEGAAIVRRGGEHSQANFRNILVYSTNGEAACGDLKQVLNLIYGRN